MVIELLAAAAIHTASAKPIADTQPYESVNESSRLYSDSAARTITGVITDTRTVKMKDGVEFMQMDVETNQGTIPVHLGPSWYMTEYADRFDVNKGRSVSVVGSVGNIQGQDVLIAAELSNETGAQQMRLRHPSGVPAWVGSEHAP